MKKLTQFHKYIIIGGINTAFGYGIFALFVFLGFHYSLAVIMATILGVLFNFQTYGRLVFKNHSNLLLVRFILVYVMIYFVNVLLIALLTSLKINTYIAGMLALSLTAYLGYIFNKRLVWKEV